MARTDLDAADHLTGTGEVRAESGADGKSGAPSASGVVVLGGAGGEASDDGAGGLGAGLPGVVQGELVLVGEYYSGVGAGEQGDDRDGAAGVVRVGADALEHVLDGLEPARRRRRIWVPRLLATRARSRGSWPSAAW